jgi:hypothetical protein
VADCLPSRILVIDTIAEVALVPIGYWVYRWPESRQAGRVPNLCPGAPHMLTGAFATGLYGGPRSTSDVDAVVDAVAGEP